MDSPQKLLARKDLPENYHPVWKFDITRKVDLILLNIGGIALLVASWFAFFALAGLLRPGIMNESFQFKLLNLLQTLGILVMLLMATAIMIVVHEGFHGLFFWIFTRTRPQFAFKVYYASASAPGWYFPRWQYILIGLAPLVGITLLGLAGLLWLPVSLVLPVVLILVFNTSGAIGDLWVVGRLLASPASTYVLDLGNSSEFYQENA